MANHVSELLELFSKTLVDAESLGVRVWTVRALGKLSEFIEQGETAEIVSSSMSLWRRLELTFTFRFTGRFPVARSRNRQRSVANPRGRR